MKQKLIAILALISILLVCVGVMIACNEECEHEYVDGICIKCKEPDPNYVAPKIDYDMSGVKFENKSVVFNGQAQTIAVTGTLPTGVTVTYEYYTNADRTTKATEVKLPGTYYVTAKFAGDDKHNKPADLKATLTITNADYDMSGITLSNKIVPFDGQAQTIELTGTLPQGVSVEYKYYSDAEHTLQVEASNVVNKGTYYVVATFTGAEGYNKPADLTATLTITGLDLGNVQFVNKEVSYNGEAQTIALTGTLPQGLSVSYKYYSDAAHTTEVLAANVKNAGVYYAIATITDGEKTETLEATLTVNKIDVTGISLGDVEYDYDGEVHGIQIMGTLPTGVTVAYKYYSDEALTTEVPAANVKNAGTYYAKAIFTVNGNYNALSDKTARVVINKAVVADFKLGNLSVVYTGSAQAYVATCELPDGVTNVTYEYFSDLNYTQVIEAASVINAGNYYVRATFAVDGNHKAVRVQNVTLTIKKGAFADLTEKDVTLTVTATHIVTDGETTKEEAANVAWDEVDKAYAIEFGNVDYTVTVSAETDKTELKPVIQYFDTLNPDGTLGGGFACKSHNEKFNRRKIRDGNVFRRQ